MCSTKSKLFFAGTRTGHKDRGESRSAGPVGEQTTFTYVSDREWARNALAADHSDNGKAPLAAASVVREGSYQSP